MEHLNVVMRLEILFFFVIAVAYIFMGLVLQVGNPFMPIGNKSSRKSCLRMFNLLLSLGMKGLKTKINWYVISKYLCISYSDRNPFVQATRTVTRLLKLTKLLIVKIITKHTALKIIQFWLP